MADDPRDGGDRLDAAFVFVRHGDPEPTEWQARHPGWVRIPATLVPRGASGPASWGMTRMRPVNPPNPGGGLRPAGSAPASRSAFAPGTGAYRTGEDYVATFRRIHDAVFGPGAARSVARNPPPAQEPDRRLEAARERAFLRLLRWEENGDVPDDVAYRARFGGHDPMTDADMLHYKPKEETFPHKRGPATSVTAAGAYQINRRTWGDAVTHLGIHDFTPKSQDRIAIWLFQQQDALDDIRKGRIDVAVRRLRTRWPSLPGGAQSRHSFTVATGKYNEFLRQALGDRNRRHSISRHALLWVGHSRSVIKTGNGTQNS